jgi:hypothetical protein
MNEWKCRSKDASVWKYLKTVGTSALGIPIRLKILLRIYKANQTDTKFNEFTNTEI